MDPTRALLECLVSDNLAPLKKLFAAALVPHVGALLAEERDYFSVGHKGTSNSWVFLVNNKLNVYGDTDHIALPEFNLDKYRDKVFACGRYDPKQNIISVQVDDTLIDPITQHRRFVYLSKQMDAAISKKWPHAKKEFFGEKGQKYSDLFEDLRDQNQDQLGVTQDLNYADTIGDQEQPLNPDSANTLKETGRWKIVKVRFRHGKIQRRRKVSNVKGYTFRGGRLKKMSAIERRHRKMGARRGRYKRRAERSSIRRHLRQTLRKRRSMGYSHRKHK